MHPRITHAVNTFLKSLALFTGTLFALFAAYMLAWGAWTCTQMVRLNAMAPASDITSYMMRRIAQREVCGVGDQIFPFFILLLGLSMATYAWHTLRHQEPANPNA